jgi:hypothetical protein
VYNNIGIEPFMQNATNTAGLRGNNANDVTVTAKRKELPRVTEKPQPTQASQKRNWRNSTASKVLRVPNELLPRVRQLLAEYRAAKCLDPDRWD